MCFYVLLFVIFVAALFWLFLLIRALFIGFISVLAAIGAIPIVALDYLSRPLTWLGISSPEICWGITGLLLFGCIGFLVSARSVTESSEYKKIYYRTLLSIFILLSVSLLSHSINDASNLKGSWIGEVYVGQDHFPATLEISRGAQEDFFGRLTVEKGDSSNKIDIELIGYLTPGTNQLYLSEKSIISNPRNAPWIVSRSKGAASLGFKRISGKGEKIGRDGKVSNSYRWKFVRASN